MFEISPELNKEWWNASPEAKVVRCWIIMTLTFGASVVCSILAAWGATHPEWVKHTGLYWQSTLTVAVISVALYNLFWLVIRFLCWNYSLERTRSGLIEKLLHYWRAHR